MKRIIVATAALALLVPLAAAAATFRTDGTYTLGREETIEGNLYAAGGNLVFEGRVNGDLIAAGGNVVVSGPVAGDILIAGGNITVQGPVDGDIRAVGGTIVISNAVGGEVVVAGGQVHVAEGAVIAGDFAVGSETITIDGEVRGSVIRPPERPEDRDGAGIAAFVSFFQVAMAVMLFTAGILFVTLFGRGTRAVVARAEANFLGEAIRGFVVLVALPVAAIIAAVSLIGMYLAILGGLVYIAALLLGSIFGSIILGSLILRYTVRKEGERVGWLAVLVGVIAFEALKFIPIVGWIACFIFFLAGFGSVLYFGWKNTERAWRQEHALL
ncbi:hypothetical protein C4552_04300 [Candidatus Parcubacteria bacterium]|nr:MAG: hypothetical protein C4552_04300 [Candidatus Parcubacteria bacterium]